MDMMRALFLFYLKLHCSHQTFTYLAAELWITGYPSLGNLRVNTKKKYDIAISFWYFCTVFFFAYLFNTLRFVRVGSVVLALHDATDVFLEIGKMSKYSGAETIASLAFILFVLSFTVLRCIYYPFWVLRSTRFVLNQFQIYIWFSFCHLLKFPKYTFKGWLSACLVRYRFRKKKKV
jgi:hypothetical protein